MVFSFRRSKVIQYGRWLKMRADQMLDNPQQAEKPINRMIRELNRKFLPAGLFPLMKKTTETRRLMPNWIHIKNAIITITCICRSLPVEPTFEMIE
jgi:hypothetical protein